MSKIEKKMPLKRTTSTFTNKGFSGFFVIVAVIFAIFLAGAFSSINTAKPVIGIMDPNNKFQNSTDKKTLQLRTLGFITVTPTTPPSPITSAPQNINCQDAINTESGILVGSDPPPGGTAIAGGKLRIWVNDERAPHVAPGTTIDANGNITSLGSATNSKDVGTDGNGMYLWEPAIYLTTISTPTQSGPYTGDAENGGKPYFPTVIKGDFNPNIIAGTGGIIGPAIDSDYVNFENGPDYLNQNIGANLPQKYTAEFIWDISSLGLQPGLYHVEEVLHDGDRNVAINCVAFQL